MSGQRLQSGNPQDLAAVQRQRRARWTKGGELENGGAAPTRRSGIQRVDRPADHQPHDVGGARSALLPPPAILPSRNTTILSAIVFTSSMKCEM